MSGRARSAPGLDELRLQFGAEYVLMAPELATDGVDLLWDFSRTKAGEGMIEAIVAGEVTMAESAFA